MILGSLALLSFGLGDLVALLPLKGALGRAAAAAAAVLVVLGVAALSGMPAGSVALTATIAMPAVAWILSAPDEPDKKHAWLLLLPIAALLGTIALSGSASPIEGDLAHWYQRLPFEFVASKEVSVDQFVLGAGVFLFLLATSNQIVKLVLATTDAKNLGDSEIKGGRLLGPMERLIVAAAVVAGDPAGAGLVVAAKGLLRFPEVNKPKSATVHALTEYLLVGTFTSVLIAGILALLILGYS